MHIVSLALLGIAFFGCPAAFITIRSALAKNDQIKHKPYLRLFIAFGLIGGCALTIPLGLVPMGLLAGAFMFFVGIPSAIVSALSLIRRRNESRYHRFILIVCVLYLLTAPLSFYLWGSMSSWEPRNSDKLANCWKSEFGYAPPATVQNIRAKQYLIYDSGCQWLYFSANSNVVESILNKGFKSVENTEFARKTGGKTIPAWWKPEEDMMTSFYHNTNWVKRYYWNEAYFAHNKDCSVVYFLSTGHD